MQVNAALNLALPIRFAEAPDPNNEQKRIQTPTMWVYHTPISMEVFDANYRMIAAAKHAIFGKSVGYAMETGPRIARLALLDAAKLDAAEHGSDEDSGIALLAELRRLTLVLAASERGFEPVPSDVAVQRSIIDKDEWLEVESAIVFFTCAYAMARRSGREAVARSMALLWGGSMTSLPPMEFVASLKTSTSAETSGASTPSSQPSSTG